MEMGPSVDHGLGVFGHAAVDVVTVGVDVAFDGTEVAHADAAAAAHAFVMSDVRLVVRNANGSLRTIVGTGAAAPALFLIHGGFAVAVHGHFPRPAATAHADVLDRAAEASQLMPLEMGQGNEDICIHDSPSDECRFENFSPVHRHFHIVRTFQTIADDELAACGQRRKAVFVGGGQMFQGLLAATHIQGIAVREERLAAQSLHSVGHGLGKVGAQEGKVSRFAEVQLDRRKLIFKRLLTS